MCLRPKKSQGRAYLQLVENRREDGQVRQRVIATLGRLDQLQGSGQLEALLQSGARFAESVLLVSAHAKGEWAALSARRIGAVKVFERLWRETGCREVIAAVLRERRFELPVARAIFLTVLQRLLAPGADRAADRWREDDASDGLEGVELHPLYRAMAWLGSTLADQQDATPFSPRCTKDRIEEALFNRRRDLCSALELVFFDTTSIDCEGDGGQTIGQRGYSKDHRPDLKQLIVGAVLDGHGQPMACELWPGNSTDVKALLPIADRLRRRFGLQRVCLVADRGMISRATIEALEQRDWPYILGARMRRQKDVSHAVLSRAGRYHVVRMPGDSKDAPAPLKVKQVMVEDRRYIVCLNALHAKKDAADRAAIGAALREQLKPGDKARVGNRGDAKYLSTDGAHFTIDEAKLKAQARYDGQWVLRTNNTFSAEEVALSLTAPRTRTGCERTIRHTTHHQHLDGYPQRVTVRRPRHPFDGQTLEVFSAATYHGALQLVLVLPDGTRLRVPAAWTDLYDPPAPRPAVLASVTQLLQAHAVVKALLRRAQATSVAAPTSPKEPTDVRAIDVPAAATARRGGTSLGDAPNRAATGNTDAACAPDAATRPGPARPPARGASQ